MKIWTEMASVVLLSACITFCGCSESDWSTDPPSPEKIAATNKARQNLGIRQIKDNWTFYGREFGCETWKENGVACKTVKYDEEYETILWEVDTYLTGREVPSPDPDSHLMSERLLVFYDYRTERFSLAVSTDDEDIKTMQEAFSETTPDVETHGSRGRTNEETLEVVEKILKKWNLNRL